MAPTNNTSKSNRRKITKPVFCKTIANKAETGSKENVIDKDTNKANVANKLNDNEASDSTGNVNKSNEDKSKDNMTNKANDNETHDDKTNADKEKEKNLLLRREFTCFEFNNIVTESCIVNAKLFIIVYAKDDIRQGVHIERCGNGLECNNYSSMKKDPTSSYEQERNKIHFGEFSEIALLAKLFQLVVNEKKDATAPSTFMDLTFFPNNTISVSFKNFHLKCNGMTEFSLFLSKVRKPTIGSVIRDRVITEEEEIELKRRTELKVMSDALRDGKQKCKLVTSCSDAVIFAAQEMLDMVTLESEVKNDSLNIISTTIYDNNVQPEEDTEDEEIEDEVDEEIEESDDEGSDNADSFDSDPVKDFSANDKIIELYEMAATVTMRINDAQGDIINQQTTIQNLQATIKQLKEENAQIKKNMFDMSALLDSLSTSIKAKSEIIKHQDEMDTESEAYLIKKAKMAMDEICE